MSQRKRKPKKLDLRYAAQDKLLDHLDQYSEEQTAEMQAEIDAQKARIQKLFGVE